MLVEMRFWSEMRILQGIPKLESEHWPPVRQSLKELKGQIITKKEYIRSDNSWLIIGSVNYGFGPLIDHVLAMVTWFPAKN